MGKKRTYYKKQQIPFFINKLATILNNPANKQIITWSDSGNEFLIKNQSELIKNVLPEYFKHHNLASFVRQLNLYGFHKMENVSQYSHQNFKRNLPDQFKLIKRIVKNKKKKQLNQSKNKAKQRERQYNCQEQLEKLTQQNQRLKQENKRLIKNKKDRESILTKLRVFTRNSKRHAKIFDLAELKQNYTEDDKLKSLSTQKNEKNEQLSYSKGYNLEQNPSTYIVNQNNRKSSLEERFKQIQNQGEMSQSIKKQQNSQSQNSIDALCSMNSEDMADSLINSYLS